MLDIQWASVDIGGGAGKAGKRGGEGGRESASGSLSRFPLFWLRMRLLLVLRFLVRHQAPLWEGWMRVVVVGCAGN